MKTIQSKENAQATPSSLTKTTHYTEQLLEFPRPVNTATGRSASGKGIYMDIRV